ncbi:hypothetical protein BKA70DRAFT_1240402 [Coprinopsis sp. MPI-PUGE-AT-0042]|nr:hypothetical protein BKA70DRAFT_1240402 [Coprinopsis sp. MPI-PUGE-AT-0042]
MQHFMDALLPGGSGATTPNRSGSISPEFDDSFGASRTNATLRARRLTTRLKLGPYSQELETYADEDAATRELMVFAKMLAFEQKLASLSGPSAAYAVDQALMANIKSYSWAVLLSPKLSLYKGNIPRNRVMDVLKHLKVNTPSNMDTNRHVLKVILEAISFELTQARARIKKLVILSRGTKPLSIYQLATQLVASTQCCVSVPLCARLAILRLVAAKPGQDNNKYWDHVNAMLKSMKATANNNEGMIHAILAGYLEEDRTAYGTAAQQSVQAEALQANTWQTQIDTALANPSTEADDEDEE